MRVHPIDIYINVKLQLTEGGEREGATEGFPASSFYTSRFSLFPSFLRRQSAKVFSQIVINVPLIGETENQTEPFHGFW